MQGSKNPAKAVEIFAVGVACNRWGWEVKPRFEDARAVLYDAGIIGFHHPDELSPEVADVVGIAGDEGGQGKACHYLIPELVFRIHPGLKLFEEAAAGL